MDASITHLRASPLHTPRALVQERVGVTNCTSTCRSDYFNGAHGSPCNTACNRAWKANCAQIMTLAMLRNSCTLCAMEFS
eukprot:437891-Amphidinium_carterae.2